MAKVAHLLGVVGQGGKLIRDAGTKELELYDLFVDPGERVNLAADAGRGDVRRDLRAELDAWQAACAERALPRHSGHWSNEEMDELSKLGYLDSGD